MKGQFRAVNRYISKIKSTSSIDSSSNTGTFSVEDIAVSGFSLPQWNCTLYVTVDFAQTAKEEIFRITNITGDVLTFDKRISVGGYIKPAHASGASVRVNDVADVVNDLSDNVDTFGRVLKSTTAEAIIVSGGYFNNNGTTYTVANQTFTISGGQLVDNTTNYVYLNLATQLFVITQTAVLTAAIQMASITCAAWVITVITDKRPAFFTTYAEIASKLDKTGGLRDTMWASRGIMEVNVSGNEVKAAVVDGINISPTETIRKRKADGTYEDVPYSFIQSDATANVSEMAWEALTVGDSVFLESYVPFALATSQQPISYSAFNTRVEIPVFGSGVASDTFKLPLKKTGTPAQNLNVRIETDNSWLASGTLFHANGVSSITAASLSTSFADTTITLTGSITIPLGTKVWIVLYAGTYGSESISPTNYYSVGTAWNGDVGSVLKSFRYNGTTHTSTQVSQSATWTGETSVWIFSNSSTNFTAVSNMKITSVVKSSNTTTSGTNTCFITQGSNTISASFGAWHTATFATPMLITPGAYTIQFTYSGNSNCYESTANGTTSDLFFVTSGSGIVRDIRTVTATEVLSTPYVSGIGFNLSVLAKTNSGFGYKLGFAPRIASSTYAQGATAVCIVKGPITYPGLTEGAIYYVSTGGAIATTSGTIKMPIGTAIGGKLIVDRFDTGIVQQLSVGASTTSTWFYHHGWAVTVVTTWGTVQTQTSPDNVTYSNFFNITNLGTMSLNIPQGYVRVITSAGGACTLYN